MTQKHDPARDSDVNAPTEAVQTTVVVPVWGEYLQWLQRAVASLLAQDIQIRVIVVDNASTDPVPFLEGAEVVRLPARLTLGAARNRGLAEVRSPYVVFWDADDVALPGTLSRLQAGMEADRRRVAFAMAIQEADSCERHRWPRRRLARLVRFPRLLAILNSVWSQFPTTGATIISTEAAKRGGGFSDAESGDDWSLGVSLAFQGRVGWSERPGRLYQRRTGSVWSSYFSLAHQRRHARTVRQRVREDPSIPTWARGLLPVILVGQNAALAAHAFVNGARRRRVGSG